MLCAELQQKAKDPGEGGSVRFSDYAHQVKEASEKAARAMSEILSP